MINVILFLLAFIGLVFTCSYIYNQVRFRKSIGAPKIFYSTIQKHSKYNGDKKIAENLLTTYNELEDYRKLLIAYSAHSGKDLKYAVKRVSNQLPKLKIIAKEYRSTEAYTEDKELVKARVEQIISEVRDVQDLSSTDTKYLRKALKQGEVSLDSISSFMKIHNENLRKCDIIRPHNHKSTPLKDLSIELITMLKNIEGKSGMESARDEIYQQLTQLSGVIDNCIEDLPTYDSKKFVDNKLKINKKIMEEIENTQYVDVFKVEVKEVL